MYMYRYSCLCNSWSDSNVTKHLKNIYESEFEQYRVIQDRLYQSDFDRLVADAELK